MISIQNNMGGLRAMDGLQQSHLQLQVSLERLSTGLRINRAEDDAAGVMQRDRFTSQTQGLTEAIRNIQTAQGMVQVAEQGLNKVTEALQQMRSLAVRAADDNLTDTDRSNIQNQVKGLLKEINSRAQTTVYNGHNLLDGSITDSVQARNGSSRVQTNSFLATGQTMVSSTATTGTAATTSGAISQGSYEVKLVFSGQNGVKAAATASTALAGVINSPSNAASVTTMNQVVTDRNGGAHTASFTFSELSPGNRNYTYSVTVPAGGVYGASAQTYSGTMSFNADGSIGTVDGHPPGALQRNVTIADGTATGQAWNIDFSGLQENQHATVNAVAPSTASAAATNGSGTPSTGVTVTGNLDTTAAQNTYTGALLPLNVVDRLGVTRTLNIALQKQNNTSTGNDTWNWFVNNFGGTQFFGSGGASSPSSGSVTFAGGAFSSQTGTTIAITDSDGYTQNISLDLSGLTNLAAPFNTTQTQSGGTAGAPTSAVSVTASLNQAVGGTVTTPAFSVVDNSGLDTVAGNNVSFSYLGGNSWSYAINPNTTNGNQGRYTGAGTNLTGTVSFDSGGNVSSVNGVAGNTVATAWTNNLAVPENQNITFSFANVKVQTGGAVATSNGAAATPSTTFNVGGAGANHLASTHVVSDSVTTTSQQLYDRTGADHSVSVTYTKLSNDATGSSWGYSVNGLSGGVWNGANSGNTTGVLHFDASGVLNAVNGASGTNVSMLIGDGTAAGQALSINFAGLNNTGAAADNVAQVPTGSSGNPTTNIALSDNLVGGTSPTTVGLDVYDRTGTNFSSTTAAVTQKPQITFSQVNNTNTWNYTVTAPIGSGFNGFGSGLQGQVTFNAAGNITSVDGSSTLNKAINFGDGTAEGQSINLDFAQLNMAHATDLTNSLTDGGQGTNVGEVNAVVYFSDGTGTNGAANPVSTLVGVDLGAKSYNAGGISITVAQASTLDVGLTSYVKAHTYISAVKDDRSLQFQIGSDEGQTNRVGIAKMDVQTLFRGHGTDADYSNVDLSNTLKAQDLIGQVDDAINFVSAQNLKVGQFANSFARTLDVQRQNMTSISGALSNINDADMAVEATNQSKRSILVQSGTAMVAQANTQGQFLLQLLR